jgi:hypothetical protein
LLRGATLLACSQVMQHSSAVVKQCSAAEPGQQRIDQGCFLHRIQLLLRV